ncbi:MAG: OmpA family protein [Myxococcales bacterium]|nr:OmpA family protein [Myxococcales bacterium]
MSSMLAAGVAEDALGAASTGGAQTEPSAEGRASLEVGGKADAKGSEGQADAKGSGKGSGKGSKRSKGKADAKPKDGEQTPWIRRYPPTRNMVELGIMGGVYLPGANHELFEPDISRPEQGFVGLATVAPEIGLRLSYLPLRILGIEAEGAVMPTRTDTDASATLWTVRAGLLGQIPKWSVTPFGVVGFGILAVSSARESLGNDIDPSLYFGGGVKLNLSRRTQLRLDLRDVVSHKRGVAETFENHNFEALLSFALVLNRPKPAPPPPPPDSDGDGFIDTEDACPSEAGVAPDGCPIRDSDGDGFLDPEDACVDEPGVAPDGCPVRDSDGDGFLDDVDACPTEAGVDPDGCPIRDQDGDGILDDADDCVSEPETPNGYEDGDGCPDEVPEEVVKFTGVIKGIQFETDSAKIRPRSTPILDQAIEVLTKYPSVRVEVSGHTDDRGSRDHNVELSKSRADAVRDYLVSKGIDAARVETRGAGPDEPIDSNKSKKGRAQNRRIEFKILQQ